MDDLIALMRAIRLHPAEDTPRLMVADWYEEHDQPHRAELIRLQIRNPSSSRLSSLFHSATHGWRQWIPAPFFPHEVQFERGFIAGVRCDCPKFYEHAGVLFREGVMGKVKLSDRRAESDMGQYYWSMVHNWPTKWRMWEQTPNQIPPGIYDNLPLVRNRWGDERRGRYEHRHEANADLARAALAYGRSRAAELEGVAL